MQNRCCHLVIFVAIAVDAFVVVVVVVVVLVIVFVVVVVVLVISVELLLLFFQTVVVEALDAEWCGIFGCATNVDVAIIVVAWLYIFICYSYCFRLLLLKH